MVKRFDKKGSVPILIFALAVISLCVLSVSKISWIGVGINQEFVGPGLIETMLVYEQGQKFEKIINEDVIQLSSIREVLKSGEGLMKIDSSNPDILFGSYSKNGKELVRVRYRKQENIYK